MDWYLTVTAILILFGLFLMIGEFLLPTGGLLVVAGFLAMIVAVAIVLYHGEPTEAAATVVSVCIGIPIVWNVGMFLYRKVGGRLELKSESLSTTVANDPEISSLDRLRGRIGKTVTPMRPSGSVMLDDRRVDAITEGMMLDSGVWVRCVDVKAGKVIVRHLETTGDLGEIDLEQ